MKKIIYSPGEPAGIGPDLIIQLAASKAWENFKIPIITIGDPVLFIEIDYFYPDSHKTHE